MVLYFETALGQLYLFVIRLSSALPVIHCNVGGDLITSAIPN